jgi:hypothetical protein
MALSRGIMVSGNPNEYVIEAVSIHITAAGQRHAEVVLHGLAIDCHVSVSVCAVPAIKDIDSARGIAVPRSRYNDIIVAIVVHIP